MPGTAEPSQGPGHQATDVGVGGSEIRCSASDSFQHWLRGAGGSVAITTYQAGKVALVGWDSQRGQITLLLRQFDKPMGLAVRHAAPRDAAGTTAAGTAPGMALALATRHAVLLLADAPLLAPDYLEDRSVRYDALYLPRVAYFTGDLNVHDLAFATAAGAGPPPTVGTSPATPDPPHHLWLVNTRFSCLSDLSPDFSFVPRWKPPFISEIVPEDRCHLNGLAVRDGRPAYVTCLGETDVVGGWRPNKAAGGVVVDVAADAVVLRGLCMPHSPRWYKDQLWLLNSGAGELWAADVKTGRHVVICALPAYLRGLSFVGPYALIGMCQIREKHIFGGLPVQQKHPRLLCGVAVVDLRDGQVAGLFEFTGGVQELFEVQFLPGVHRPMIVGPEKEQARQAFTAPAFSYWLRPSNEIRDNPNAPPGAAGDPRATRG